MAEIKKRFSKKYNKWKFTASIRIKGYPSITETFDRLTDAKQWASQTESDIRRGISLSQLESRKHTLNDLIDRYIETELPKRKSDQAKFLMQLNWWKDKIGAYYLSNITTSLLTECRDELAKEDSLKPKNGKTTRSNATVNRYIYCLSTVFSIAVRDWEWLNENPMHKVRKFKEDNQRTRFLTEQEVAKLLHYCKESSYVLYLIVLIALSTGARYGEILNLTWNNVDLKNDLFYFMNTKNGDNRGVPITSIVKKELLSYQKQRSSILLFPNHNGTKPIDIRKGFRNALKKANIKDFHFHDLRHTGASFLAMSGKTLSEIAEVLGHKTLQMVKRYSHLTKGHTKKVLEDMNSKLFSEVNEG